MPAFMLIAQDLTERQTSSKAQAEKTLVSRDNQPATLCWGGYRGLLLMTFGKSTP